MSFGFLNHLFCYTFSASMLQIQLFLKEVDRFGLTDVFIDKHDAIQIVPNKYARKGNVIICGYDKAETFMDVFYGEII